MSKLKDDLEKAEYLIDNPMFCRSNDVNFERLYPFTNENIKDMFNCFDFKNKDCLSILGSSD